MPYLMTDAAAGSDATMQLMQNMGGAPYAMQEGAAKAQEAGVKLQQEQLKVQQDQANVEKTKLANMVMQSGIQLDKQKQEAISKLQGSAGWGQLSAEDQLDKMAIAIAPFDPGDAEKMISASASSELKKAQAKSKELDNNREEISKASAIMDALPDDKAAAMFDKFNPEQKKLIIDKVGQENWDKMTSGEKKKTVHNLMENSNQKIQELKISAELEMTRMRDEMQLEKERQRGNAQIAARASSSTKNNNAWRQVNQELDTIEKRGQKRLDALNDEVDTARTQATKWHSLMPGSYEAENPETHEKMKGDSKADYDKYVAAVKKRDKALSQKYDDEEDVIRTLPSELKDLRDRELQRIEKQRSTLALQAGVDTPKPVKGAKQEPKKEAQPAASSEPLSEEDFNAQWKDLEKGESLVGPDGKTYTKK